MFVAIDIINSNVNQPVFSIDDASKREQLSNGGIYSLADLEPHAARAHFLDVYGKTGVLLFNWHRVFIAGNTEKHCHQGHPAHRAA